MDNNPEFIDGRWHFDPNAPVYPPTEVNVFDQDRMEQDEDDDWHDEPYSEEEWVSSCAMDCELCGCHGDCPDCGTEEEDYEEECTIPLCPCREGADD